MYLFKLRINLHLHNDIYIYKYQHKTIDKLKQSELAAEEYKLWTKLAV